MIKMSQENNTTFGKDIAYSFNNDGTIDLEIDDSGDIKLVGGDINDSYNIRRENAIQQIKLRLLTRKNSLLDENGNAINFGSDLHSTAGEKDNNLSKLAVRAYVINCIQDYVWIEAISKIDVDFPEPGIASVTIGIKLIDDSQLIEVTTGLGG